MREIKFKEKKFFLIGDTEGLIATKEQYQKGRCNYAHLYPDGKIRRFGKVIGTRKDIKFGKETDIFPTANALFNILMLGKFTGEIK